MPKLQCPTCDRPVTSYKPCPGCTALARFDSLKPIDYRGEGDLGYSSYSWLYADPPTEPPKSPRFLCLRDWEVIPSDSVDAGGVPLVGQDRYGAWFGTSIAPCVVRGSADTAIVILMGRLNGKAWTGYYLGDRKEALRAMPEDVMLEFIELRPVPLPT